MCYEKKGKNDRNVVWLKTLRVKQKKNFIQTCQTYTRSHLHTYTIENVLYRRHTNNMYSCVYFRLRALCIWICPHICTMGQSKTFTATHYPTNNRRELFKISNIIFATNFCLYLCWWAIVVVFYVFVNALCQ